MTHLVLASRRAASTTDYYNGVCYICPDNLALVVNTINGVTTCSCTDGTNTADCTTSDNLADCPTDYDTDDTDDFDYDDGFDSDDDLDVGFGSDVR